jgi:hypothetical protein
LSQVEQRNQNARCNQQTHRALPAWDIFNKESGLQGGHGHTLDGEDYSSPSKRQPKSKRIHAAACEASISQVQSVVVVRPGRTRQPALLENQFDGALAGRVLAMVDEVQEGGGDNPYRHANRLNAIVNAEVVHAQLFE